MRIERRDRNARSTRLLSSSSAATRARSPAAGSWITSPSSRTTALRYGGPPPGVGAGGGGQVWRLAREQVDLAEEAAGPVHGDDAVLAPVALHDGHGAGLDDEEVIARVALPEEHLAARDGPCRPRGAHPGALVGVQPREGAVPVGRLLHAGAEGLAPPADPSGGEFASQAQRAAHRRGGRAARRDRAGEHEVAPGG